MIFVTGAAGLLGNSLLRVAVERGVPAAAMLRDGRASRALDGLSVPAVVVDLSVDSLEKHLERASVVVHCAARVAIGRRNMAQLHRDNVVATARVAAACRVVGARLVHVSTVDTLAWGTPEAPGDETPAGALPRDTTYATTKRLAEAAVEDERRRGLDAVILHPGYLIGPWDWKPSSGRMLLAAVRGPVAIAPPGGNDFCHAGVVAEAVLEVALRRPPSDRYILSGEALSYTQAFRLMRQAAGRAPRVVTAPAWMVRIAGRAGDGWGAITGREPDVNSAAAAVACLPHHFSSARAMAEIGYRPRPAIEAMREAWTWFVEHGYA